MGVPVLVDRPDFSQCSLVPSTEHTSICKRSTDRSIEEAFKVDQLPSVFPLFLTVICVRLAESP